MESVSNLMCLDVPSSTTQTKAADTETNDFGKFDEYLYNARLFSNS